MTHSLSNVQVVILAAGKSSRLYPLTLHRPKSLLEFGSELLLVRTVRQLHSAGFTAIRIVVGHMQQQIRDALANFHDAIEFIYNDRYETDTNSLSLYKGLAESEKKSALVIEADVVLSDSCWPIIAAVCRQAPSVWFTHGMFLPHQKGGIIKSDAARKITDMQIVPHFAACYQDYAKNLGVVYIGPGELDHYQAILRENVVQSATAYYMDHWIAHLAELYCEEHNLFPNPAGSFNTLEELEYCRRYFQSLSS